MNFIESTSTQILEGGITVKTFEYGHSGLGYYINPKPVVEPATAATVSVDGGPEKTLMITHESEQHDWYCVFHVRSHRSVGLLFFSEIQAMQAVRKLAPLIDWTLDDNALLAQQEAWELVGQKIMDIRRSA